MKSLGAYTAKERILALEWHMLTTEERLERKKKIKPSTIEKVEDSDLISVLMNEGFLCNKACNRKIKGYFQLTEIRTSDKGNEELIRLRSTTPLGRCRQFLKWLFSIVISAVVSAFVKNQLSHDK